MNALIGFNAPRMTSLEISELVGSQHGNVCISIERLAKKEVIKLPPRQKVENKQSLSPNNKTNVYIFTGEQGKRDSIIVVAQLSPEFTARLVDRWQELEAKQNKPAFNIPQTYAQALRLAADQQEVIEKQAEQIEAAQPAIEFHERVGVAEDCHSIDETAKLLRAKPHKFRAFLKNQINLFRRDGIPRQDFLDRGYVRVIEKTIELPHGYKLHAQTFFTGKGLQWIQRRLDRSLVELAEVALS